MLYKVLLYEVPAVDHRRHIRYTRGHYPCAPMESAYRMVP